MRRKMRYCTHCWTFNRNRKEMIVDSSHMEKWARRIDMSNVEEKFKYMAECPECHSIEYFFENKQRLLESGVLL